MSPSNLPSPPPTDVEEQPLARIERDGLHYTLLGTAHVSRASAEAVEQLLNTGTFDAVAVELDPNRHAALTDPDRWAKLDLFQVVRQGKAGMVAANLALGAFQQRLADQLGIEPGQEMRVAIRAAEEASLPLLLIDRDIGVTLRRTYRNVPWWQRFTLLGSLFLSTLSREEITAEEVEKLRQGDILEATFTEFAENSQALYTPLIAERDRYMAAKLEADAESRENPFTQVLVVIGAGHLKGLREHLEAGVPDHEAELERLEQVPSPGPWPKVLPWIITALALAGFAIGFSRSPQLGLELIRDWFLINGVLAGLGALIALAHPLTVVGTFLAAPFTSLNPLIGAGFVAAGLELWLRKPKVADFRDLRPDLTSARGWWRNRVTRTLLVFLLATTGSVLGTYLAGFRIFGRLFG